MIEWQSSSQVPQNRFDFQSVEPNVVMRVPVFPTGNYKISFPIGFEKKTFERQAFWLAYIWQSEVSWTGGLVRF